MHVDPIVVTTRALVDGTGHPSEIIAKAIRRAFRFLAEPRLSPPYPLAWTNRSAASLRSLTVS